MSDWLFDLQLHGGGGPNAQQNKSDQYYQQQANDSNQLFNQWMTTYWPIVQQYLPELQNTIQGQNTPIMQAAMAPVNAQTSRSLNTMQNNIGGVTNADAAYSDIALNGQQQAGLSADQALLGSMTALQNLLGMGSNNAGQGVSGLGNAAGGEANLGQQIWNDQNAWWQGLLGAAGSAAGYFGGKGGTPAAGGGAITTPQSNQMMTIFGPQAMPQTSMIAGLQPGLSVDSNNQSTPISSSGPGPWTGVGPQP